MVSAKGASVGRWRRVWKPGLAAAMPAAAISCGVPLWAMGYDSPVFDWWVQLTLALWAAMIGAGALLAAVRRPLALGFGVCVGTVVGAVAYVALYTAAFLYVSATIGWD